MPIQVFVADEQSDEPVEAGRWGELAERVLADLTDARDEMELNILFVDAATIASMNERFLGQSGPTDVLSFPIEDDVLGAAGLGPPGSMAPGGSGPGRWDDEERPAGGAGTSGPGRWDDEGGEEATSGLRRRSGGGGRGLVRLRRGRRRDERPSHTSRRRRHLPGGRFAARRRIMPAPIAEELALLVVHGILHLCGMDHENDDEATEMEALEQVLLDRHFRDVRA